MIPEENRPKFYGTPIDNYFEEHMSIERASYFAKMIPNMYKDKVIADMGAGNGTAARHLIEKHKATKVYAIEINPDAILLAKTKNNLPQIEYLQEPISKCSLPNDSVDVISATEIIEHVDEEERTLTLNEWHRVLKIPGLLYITTPVRRLSKDKYPNSSHWTEYDYAELIDIVTKQGFKFIIGLKPNQTDGISMALLFEKGDKHD